MTVKVCRVGFASVKRALPDAFEGSFSVAFEGTGGFRQTTGIEGRMGAGWGDVDCREWDLKTKNRSPAVTYHPGVRFLSFFGQRGDIPPLLGLFYFFSLTR